MTDRPKTWGDIFRRRDPDYDARRAETKHRELVEAHGCVIRSLNSILSVPLTRDQERLRFGLAQGNTTDLLSVLLDKRSRGEQIGDIHVEIQRMIQAERDRILDYINQLAKQTDTPAGRELHKYIVRFATLDLREMLTLHKAGQKIMLLTPHHAAHITPFATLDGFVLLSDDNEKVEGIDPQKQHDMFVFKKR